MKAVTVSMLPKQNVINLPKSVVPAFYDIGSNELILKPLIPEKMDLPSRQYWSDLSFINLFYLSFDSLKPRGRNQEFKVVKNLNCVCGSAELEDLDVRIIEYWKI